MATRPKRLCTNDLLALGRLQDLLGDIERTLEPIARRDPMLWETASDRAKDATIFVLNAKLLVTEILTRKRSPDQETP